jgi:hypothetical protein
MLSNFFRFSAVALFGVLSVIWTIQPTPSPHSGQFQSGDDLTSVSAVSPSDAFAVGNGGSIGIFEHWNGRHWTLQPSPMTHGICAIYSVTLNRVVALSATDAWAVGTCINQIIEHWNGVSWKIASAPAPCRRGSILGQLHDVAAISSTDVWTVGVCGSAISLHWNGSTWSVVPTPQLGQYYLTAVAGTSASDVWAMGNVLFSNRGVVLHWNGSTWTRVASAPAPVATFVRRIVALSPTNAWAVGEFDSSSVQSKHPMVEHWNGHAWTVVPTPDLGATTSLRDVAAVSADDIWAAGFVAKTNPIGVTLALHWNGTKWSVVPTPSPNQNALLQGIAALGDGSVWGVGAYLPQNTPIRTMALFTRE